MIGHSDITKDGSPVGRVVLDTEKRTMKFYVLESCAETLDSILASAGAPKGIRLESEVIKDEHFFDLFTEDEAG